MCPPSPGEPISPADRHLLGGLDRSALDPLGIANRLKSCEDEKDRGPPFAAAHLKTAVEEEFKMSHRSRPSSSARLSGYAAVATAAGAASTASAAVVIVDLPPQLANGITINLGVAVGAASTAFQGLVRINQLTYPGVCSGGTLNFAGGEFFTGRFFGASSVISNGAAGGTWVGGGLLSTLADGATGYFGFRLPSGSDKVYGWIEVTRISDAVLLISRWAYESQTNTGITTPAASAVPGGTGLAALAIGAAGLRGRRRGRN